MSDIDTLEGLEDRVEAASRCPDVYVFYEDTPREPGKVVGRYDTSSLPPAEFRFIADLDRVTENWGWTAFAIFELPNLFKLTTHANGILLQPVDPDASKAVKFGAAVLRHTKHFPHFAYARVQANRGETQFVLDQIDGLTGYGGSAMVSGTYSILAELGGDTPDDVDQAVGALGEIAGLSGHDAGRVVGTYYYRAPGQAEGGFFEVGERSP